MVGYLNIGLLKKYEPPKWLKIYIKDIYGMKIKCQLFKRGVLLWKFSFSTMRYTPATQKAVQKYNFKGDTIK